jgi:hypothetical protein
MLESTSDETTEQLRSRYERWRDRTRRLVEAESIERKVDYKKLRERLNQENKPSWYDGDNQPNDPEQAWDVEETE